MQLIFETERTAGNKGNMSTLEDSVGEKLITDAIMDSFSYISNGNKENIQKQDNIFMNENKACNNIKLDDEELSAPIVEVDIEVITEKNDDKDNMGCKPVFLLENELPDTSESHDIGDNAEKVHLTSARDKCCQDDVSNSCNNEVKDELRLIQQRVDDILVQQISNTPKNPERGEEHTQRSITEESNADTMKEAKENLMKSIESGRQILEDNHSTKKNTLEKKYLSENDITSSDNYVRSELEDINEIEDNQVVVESDITVEATCGVIKEAIQLTNNENTVCPGTQEEKGESHCIETYTIDEKNRDTVDNILPEPMNIEEICKEIDIENHKEVNEITFLGSPVIVDIESNKEDNNSSNTAMDCDNVSEMVEDNNISDVGAKDKVSEMINDESVPNANFVASQDEVMILDKDKENSQETIKEKQEIPPQNQIEKEPEKTTSKNSPVICRLSNSLNILSDDEDEPPKTELPKDPTPDKQCINLEDDDDIMLIDEDTNSKDSKTEKPEPNKTESNESELAPKQNEEGTDLETGENTKLSSTSETSASTIEDVPASKHIPCVATPSNQKNTEETSEKILEKPLLPDSFLKSSRKNIADMTREDLEEFCILKIVEGIVDRSNLSEIKTKLKLMAQSLEEYKKKAMMLTKQNKDLEVVLKSVQEEQKRRNCAMVTPLKITRSVGMQVYMAEKLVRKKSVSLPPAPAISKTRSSTNTPPKPNKVPSSPTIPVPRLIPANNAAIRGPVPQTNPTVSGKQANAGHVNGVRAPAPVQKVPEKRPMGKSQSVTVDLTDDEPPAKMASRGPTPPVRLVPSQNLMPPHRPQFGQTMNTPRKVYIPISGPQGQQIKPGQTIMVKTSPTGPNRQRAMAPTITRLGTNQVRMNRVGQSPRHPAALPDIVKQYQPANWKSLPPAPDLKLSKVENGIVISWKIEGYPEDSYEEIASYQLYAYQETSSPPSTALWKKIGDVKALPLPMACTLTQFMAGFKYYFAVRAVDVKSRVGPFSLPGSILLLNKM